MNSTPPASRDTPDISTPFGTRHILCIDDVPEVLLLLHDVLCEAGYRVTTWTSADEDLNAVSALAPDLIVVDYLWGHGKDSWAFLQWLKLDHRTRHIPAILLSGALHLLGERRDTLRRMGIVMIRKPFDLDGLVRTIETMLATDGA